MNQQALPPPSDLAQPPPLAATQRAAHRAALRELGEAARVRLAAPANTASETLGVLAADASVTVRAAVAINPAAPERAHRLLAADADERVRTLLARKLAALLPHLPLSARNAVEARTLAILTQLVEDEAVRVRAAVADVVKEMHGAPRDLILRLARDCALPVCEPVIRLSPLLSTEDLLSLLADMPEPGVAVAVACRRGLPASVSDRLAASADNEAIEALLDNGSAAIREATLDALIERAVDYHSWQSKLVKRPALSARNARALCDIVTTQLLAVLASRGDLDPSVTLELRRRLADRQPPPPPSPPPATVYLGPKLEDAMVLARDWRRTSSWTKRPCWPPPSAARLACAPRCWRWPRRCRCQWSNGR